ncbi:MAG: acyl-CoA dehydrogenase family protein [Pseudomonadota bacterium]
MADPDDSALDAFRAQTRDWLEANFPKSLANVLFSPIASSDKPSGDVLLWRQRMADKGWGTPTWPTEYGGGGLSGDEARVLQQEMARIGAANPLISLGAMMLGPTLLEYGTPSQKQRHLPPISRGELQWCQGYSEPGAGSDLASLQTKCVDAGDHWLINGSKIWTSGAHHADWCFCLVRTDTSKKHGGISFVLVPMRQAGVEARPIKMIAGNSHFCQVFLTDARADKDDMVGPLNGGWTVGKRLLQYERSGHGGARMMVGADVVELAKKYIGVDAEGRIADPDLRTRIIRHVMDARAHMLTMQRVQAEATGNPNPSAATSVTKNSGTWIGQEKAELALEILGNRGLGWEGDEFTEQELEAVRIWLSGRATTIFGGSQEVQSNIVSKQILGLPDATKNR